MRRREFVGLLGAAAAAWPLAARAQQRKVPVIGWLHFVGPESSRAFMPSFHQGLAETGYVEGRNVAIEHRWAEGRADRRPALIADLVRRRVAVVVTDTTGFAAEVKAATQTIPIVFASAGGDPVEFGLVASLNRPGGNATGIALLGVDIMAKRLELLHKLVPTATPIAMFASGVGVKFAEAETKDLQSAARTLGVRVLILNPTMGGIAAAFTTLVGERAGALLIGASIGLQQERDQIISLAARHAIPTMFWDSASAAAGGLSSYGPDFAGAYYQTGLYVGRILMGVKPADLPVVQPTKFELVINLKTAKVLDITIPPMLLALADRVIE